MTEETANDTIVAIVLETGTLPDETVDLVEITRGLLNQCEGLTDDELAILYTLFQFYLDDISCTLKSKAGWANKYQISKRSGVSQKKIYSEIGPIETLIEKGLVEQRSSTHNWGGEKYRYRICPENEFVKDLLESIDEKDCLPEDSLEAARITQRLADQYKGMTADETAVLQTLVQCYLHDVSDRHPSRAGWLNKHRISKRSGVSQKKIYREAGPVESLMVKDLVVRRCSPVVWGRQKYQYRISLENPTIRNALYDEYSR